MEGWHRHSRIILGPAPHLRIGPSDAVGLEDVWQKKKRSAHAFVEPRDMPGVLTQWCVLEREGHDVLDSLDGVCRRVSWEAFADDNLDSTNVIAGAPMILVQ